MAEILQVQVDELGNIRGASSAFLQLTGYAIAEILGQKIDHFILSVHSGSTDLKVKSRSGKDVVLRRLSKAEWSFVDVSDLYEALLAEKRVSNRKLKELEFLIEAGDIGTWEWNLESNSVRFNRRWSEMIGLEASQTPQEIKTWDERVHPDDKASAYADIQKYLEGKSRIYRNIHRMRHHDGHWVTILDQGKVLEYKNGKPFIFVGTHTDLTEEYRLREELDRQKIQMAHVSKMAGISDMASGIAHEINNPLAIISGSVQLLGKVLEKEGHQSDQTIKFLDRIEKTVQRISKIIRGLRLLARDSSLDGFENTPVKSIIDDTLVFCESKIKNNGVLIQVDPCDLSSELKLECRPVQVSQAILNLLSNSLDAVSKMSEPWIKIQVQNNENDVEIAVIDSGNGISDKIQSEMMMPFFTTKEVGQGAGLGLSVSAGIVEMHHGKLLYDKNSSNTRFVMRLPKVQPIKQGQPSLEKKAA